MKVIFKSDLTYEAKDRNTKYEPYEWDNTWLVRVDKPELAAEVVASMKKTVPGTYNGTRKILNTKHYGV